MNELDASYYGVALKVVAAPIFDDDDPRIQELTSMMEEVKRIAYEI